MAITESKKQSDIEKRLQLLRQQVYGKESEKLRMTQLKPANQKAGESAVESFRSDTAYLHQDLFKILILSSLAIGIQLILFILTRNHILNLFF